MYMHGKHVVLMDKGVQTSTYLLLSTTVLTKFEELCNIYVKWCTLFYSPISIYLLWKYWCMHLLINVRISYAVLKLEGKNMDQGTY